MILTISKNIWFTYDGINKEADLESEGHKELTERQQEIYKLYYDLDGNINKMAKHEKISDTNIRKHLCLIAKKLFFDKYNKLPDQYSPVAPQGWSSIFKTVQYQKNEDGLEIKNVWDRIKPDEFQIKQFWKYLEKRTPILDTIIPGPEKTDENLCLEWLLCDHHLGMLSYHKETGEDYNSEIAQKLIIKAAQKIFSNIGCVAKTIIVLGGDNIHTDNRSAVTEKAGHHLDVDSRYAKTIDCIYEGMVTAIDIAAQKSKKVLVEVLSGNHDYHSAINLARILCAHYRKNDRIEVDISPSKHKYTRWGNTYFLYTHGDTGTNKRLATFFLNWLLENNTTDIKRKLIRRAHDHKQRKEIPPGLVEEDGWEDMG